MKQLVFFLLFVMNIDPAASQPDQPKKAGRFSLSAAAGMNIHSYSVDYRGWYLKLGTEYRLWKGMSAGLRLWHSSVDDFPSRLKAVPFSQDDEANFVQRFIGISEEDWKPPNYKGFFHSMHADILSLSLGYEFRIRKKFFITPHYAFNFLRSRFMVVGLFSAWFYNDQLYRANVGYDFRYGNLTAGSIGIKLGYKLNSRWRLFADLEDIRDLNGTGWINYEAKTIGAGVRYSLK